MTWELGEDEAIRARIRDEYHTINHHLGTEAPDLSGEISPQVNKDEMIQFITETEAFALAGDVRALRPFGGLWDRRSHDAVTRLPPFATATESTH